MADVLMTHALLIGGGVSLFQEVMAALRRGYAQM